MCYERVTTLLDQETHGMNNWYHFARKLDLSEDECESIRMKTKEYPSPTTNLMNFVVQVHPNLTMQEFLRTLANMQRMDVVNVLQTHCCGKYCIIQSLHSTPVFFLKSVAYESSQLRHITLLKSKFHSWFSQKLLFPFLYATIVIYRLRLTTNEQVC